MRVTLDIQNTLDSPLVPTETQMNEWVSQALIAADFAQQSCEITVRIVNESESQQLNQEYRGKDKPTNILSFPFEVPAGVPCDLLGDLVVCQQVVEREADQQGKSLSDHWAHMLIHGTLHLLGFDHIESSEAEQMEALEVEILNQFKIQNPY